MATSNNYELENAISFGCESLKGLTSKVIVDTPKFNTNNFSIRLKFILGYNDAELDKYIGEIPPPKHYLFSAKDEFNFISAYLEYSIENNSYLLKYEAASINSENTWDISNTYAKHSQSVPIIEEYLNTNTIHPYELIITYDGDVFNSYIDGVVIDSMHNILPISKPTGIVIGNNYNETGQFIGVIGSFEILPYVDTSPIRTYPIPEKNYIFNINNLSTYYANRLQKDIEEVIFIGQADVDSNGIITNIKYPKANVSLYS